MAAETEELEQKLDEVTRLYGSSHGRKIIKELSTPDVSLLVMVCQRRQASYVGSMVSVCVE